MADDIISEEARKFILDYIDSITQWEALLLLRASPNTEWNAEVLAQRLYIATPEAERLLAKLSSQGFLAAGKSGAGFYKYHPPSKEMDARVAHVAELYARYLVPVTHLIHSKSKSKIQQFADAFRLRKD